MPIPDRVLFLKHLFVALIYESAKLDLTDIVLHLAEFYFAAEPL